MDETVQYRFLVEGDFNYRLVEAEDERAAAIEAGASLNLYNHSHYQVKVTRIDSENTIRVDLRQTVEVDGFVDARPKHELVASQTPEHKP